MWGAWGRVWPALNSGQKGMGAGREGAGWWQPLPSQLSIAHLELTLRSPSDSACPSSLRKCHPGDRDGVSLPAGSSQAQKFPFLLPMLGSCPQEAPGSWERDVGDPR